MGNYRFKMSDMLPNAWFYKLNHTSTRKLQNLTHKSTNKKVKSSPLSELPRKSSDRRRGTKKSKESLKLIVNSSVSNAYSRCHVSHESIYSKGHTFGLVQSYSTDISSGDDPVFYDLDSEFERVKVDSPSNHCDDKVENNIFISNHNHQKVEKCSNVDLVSHLGLKPIITKLDEGEHGITTAMKFQGSSMKFEEQSSCSLKKNDSIGEVKKCPVRKLRVNSVRVKLRADSQRIAQKTLTQVQGQKSVSSHSHLMSVAIVKETINPERDFKESMMEMIMENNMSTKEEFEQLLACYLSLNSGTYHELIVKVFEQIWLENTGD